MKEVHLSFKDINVSTTDIMGLIVLCYKCSFNLKQEKDGTYLITQGGERTLESVFNPKFIEGMRSEGVIVTIVE